MIREITFRITKTSDKIVADAGSNLAFALAVLPKEKRRDMQIFYAFCRVVDDLADDPGYSDEDRKAGFNSWRELVEGKGEPLAGVETEFCEMVVKRDLSRSMLLEVINGCESDLEPQTFTTFEDLRQYCFLVASAVGLVSIELFRYTQPETRTYAENLGYALQLTNILRDVAEDAGEGRIYLPAEDLERFGVTAEGILAFKPEAGFLDLMKFEAARADDYYEKAVAALPEVDRPAMRSAELMRAIYGRILARMRADNFNVFEKRYRLSKVRMLWEFLMHKFS
ncbi:squalene/phytoene synthase family protein [Verrucomicrobiales bacterium]|nr:squalene/phytoene synthase family protein [Verrucomicrobiales bacterium]